MNKFTESENWKKKSKEPERYVGYKNTQILRTAVLDNLHYMRNKVLEMYLI